MFFDSHAHYDDEAFDVDREDLLKELHEKGVDRIVDVGASVQSCKKVFDLAHAFDFIYAAIGIHPSECGELTEEEFEGVKRMLSDSKVVALGEIGLDYYWEEPDREIQRYWFGRQLELAKELNKPVIIHSRDAAAETYDLMREHKAEELTGVIHCFSYTKETAKKYLDMNYFFGIGGVVTFSNAKKLKEAVEYIPIEHILLETDCPYLAPVPFRGKRNQSSYLAYVAEEIGKIKGLSTEEVCRITFENANKLYQLEGNA